MAPPSTPEATDGPFSRVSTPKGVPPALGQLDGLENPALVLDTEEAEVVQIHVTSPDSTLALLSTSSSEDPKLVSGFFYYPDCYRRIFLNF